MLCLPPTPRACGTGSMRPIWVAPGVGASVDGLGRELWLVPVRVIEGFLGDVALLVTMALDGEDDEHEGQDAEDQRLDGVEHDFEAEEADRDERDREGRDDAEGDLTAVDVAEEAHRQRDRLDELEHELDQTDKEGDAAGG